MLDSVYLDFFYIFLGVTILVYLALFEYFKYASCGENQEASKDKTVGSYGYRKNDGPHVWKNNFQNALGECQSPINLQSSLAIVVQVETVLHPLEFTGEYRSHPRQLVLVNDGHTVNLYPEYCPGEIPKICGGPLEGSYELHCLNLRWGPNDDEGTEHMVDNRRFAMELQVTFMRPGNGNKYKACDAGEVIMISYLYQTTPIDNPYLGQVLDHLGPTSPPFNHCEIEPVPISLLAPCFSRNYFSYVGSLTHPPCTEGVRWIVQPEPLSISCCQMRKLRKTPLVYCDCGNTRPVQELNNREVIFYD